MAKCSLCKGALPTVKKNGQERDCAAFAVSRLEMMGKKVLGSILRRHKKEVYRICFDCLLDKMGIKE